MAHCAVCGCTLIVLWDEAVKLRDGRCCYSCWNKATSRFSRLSGNSKYLSSNQVCQEYNRLEAWSIAENIINGFFNEKCNEIGIPYTEPLFREFRQLSPLGGRAYSFYNKTLYSIETRFSYQYRHYYSNISTLSDVEKLVSEDLDYTVIPVERIQFYTKEGDIQYTTKISGGGGGGSSLSGAIIGGLIAGESGAIIGSRQQINPISSTTQKHDSRKTILKYYGDNGLVVIEFDGFDAYNYFQHHMPEKDLLSVQLQSTQDNPKNNDIKGKLQTLKKLYEEGLIDDAEYSTKRKEILSEF